MSEFDDVAIADRLAIRALVEDWAILRDAGKWEEFAALWHDDGWMTATWFQGPFRDFIAVSRRGFEAGTQITHFLGGTRVELRGVRAVVQTKMKIEQRARLDGIEVDVTCSGRFFDFVERRDDRWGIVRRQPIYEWDRLATVDPSAVVELDASRLATFPVGYRHLGYLQEAAGMSVLRGLPGLSGAEVELLYREGGQWLDGSPEPGVRLGAREG